MIISSGDKSSVCTCFAKAPFKNVRGFPVALKFLFRFLFRWTCEECLYFSLDQNSPLLFQKKHLKMSCVAKFQWSCIHNEERLPILMLECFNIRGRSGTFRFFRGHVVVGEMTQNSGCVLYDGENKLLFTANVHVITSCSRKAQVL